MHNDSALPFHVGNRESQLRYITRESGLHKSRGETRSVNPRGVLKPEESALQSECCSPECEATPVAGMPLGIPLCRDCMRSILERSLAYVREAKSRSILRNQKLLPGPVRDSGEPHEEVVYYVRFQNLIKIGYTGNLAQRMQNVPHHKVLAVEPGGPDLESDRHKQFAHHREIGEWFRPGDDLIEHIKAVRAKRVAA